MQLGQGLQWDAHSRQVAVIYLEQDFAHRVYGLVEYVLGLGFRQFLFQLWKEIKKLIDVIDRKLPFAIKSSLCAITAILSARIQSKKKWAWLVIKYLIN